MRSRRFPSPRPIAFHASSAGEVGGAFPRRAWLMGTAAVVASAMVPWLIGGGRDAWAQPASRSQGLFRIATGTTAGTYYPLGGIIANAISNAPGSRPCDKGGSCGVPGLIAVAQATNGSVENIGLLKNGSAEAAMVQADVGWWAYTGAGVFAGSAPFDNLRTLGTLYVEAVHLVASKASGIAGMADLRGRRVCLGEEGSGTLVDSRVLLDAFGMSDGDVVAHYLKPATAIDRLEIGELDAFFMVAGHPNTTLVELAKRVPITLIPLDAAAREGLRRERRFFVEVEIPADTYAGVPATAAVGVGAELMVRADQDPDFIYQVVKALWHERTLTLLAEGHPRGRAIDPRAAVAGVSVPLHPGAARYYHEVGLLGAAVDDQADDIPPGATL